MVDQTKCTHAVYRWKLDAVNEAGWVCPDCGFKPGEPPGYCPGLEQPDKRLQEKVNSIIYAMVDGGLVSVSNGTGMECLMASVFNSCVAHGLYDQYSIVQMVVFSLSARHAIYWKKVGDSVRAGVDCRTRCECGDIATGATLSGKTGEKMVHHCDECGKAKRYAD